MERKEPLSTDEYTGYGGTKVVRNAFFEVKTNKKPLMPIMVNRPWPAAGHHTAACSLLVPSRTMERIGRAKVRKFMD